MKNKRLQIFISSTYLDLKEERQAAVEAILKAKHIPAGMELFTAGSLSQLEVIKEWIKESDLLLLLFGARYGSIEATSGKSYTHLEYEYAKSLNIPVFALVLTEKANELKVQTLGSSAVETDNKNKYLDFKELVQNNMCSFVDDLKDIKIELLQSLNELLRRNEFSGWIGGEQLIELEELTREKNELEQQMKKLEGRLAEVQSTSGENTEERSKYSGFTFEELKECLKEKEVDISSLSSQLKGETRTLLTLFTSALSSMPEVRNAYNAGEEEVFLYYNVAKDLLKFGLTEKLKTPVSVNWSKIGISSLGYQFLAEYEKERFLRGKQKKKVATKKTTKNAPAKKTTKKTAKKTPVKKVVKKR